MALNLLQVAEIWIVLGNRFENDFLHSCKYLFWKFTVMFEMQVPVTLKYSITFTSKTKVKAMINSTSLMNYYWDKQLHKPGKMKFIPSTADLQSCSPKHPAEI